MKLISIIGAGGHTRSSVNLLRQHFHQAEYLIFDEGCRKENEEYVGGIKIAGKVNDIAINSRVFLSIGDNAIREKYFSQFRLQLLEQNLCHKTATIESDVVMGVANQLFANSYINAYSKIGDNNIINTGSILEHETVIGHHNHISVRATLCGRVCIGNRCFIGAGATIIDKVSVCDDVIIGAGALVNRNITEHGVYIGVPARKIK